MLAINDKTKIVRIDENKMYSQEDTCRICLSHSPYGRDCFFFCNPCVCGGSMKLVHFDCLKKWCQVKIKKQIIGDVTQYKLQKFNC